MEPVVSSGLKTLPYVFRPYLHFVPFSISSPATILETSPGIVFDVPEPVTTPRSTKLNSVSVFPMLSGEYENWKLKSVLLVQIVRTEEAVLATTWLEGVEEYGTGKNDDEATIDLITSLGEYLDILETRKDKLGDSALRELEQLHRLIEPSQKPPQS